MKFKVKRVYDKPSSADGFRVLVDRLWPRGISKDSAKLDLWMKNVSPSSELRTWFHADKAKRLADFEKRYETELVNTPELTILKKLIRQKKQATIVTAVKDFKYSHIPLLMKLLNK